MNDLEAAQHAFQRMFSDIDGEALTMRDQLAARLKKLGKSPVDMVLMERGMKVGANGVTVDRLIEEFARMQGVAAAKHAREIIDLIQKNAEEKRELIRLRQENRELKRQIKELKA